jgi:hypothetical protein
MLNLYQTMDRIRKRFVDTAIKRASSIKPKIKPFTMGKD